MVTYKKGLMVFLTLLIIQSFGIAVANSATTYPPISQESASDIPLLVWANEAAVTAFSYNFVNYRKNFETVSKYFTPEGWKNFKDALDKSGDLKEVINKKLVVSAVATGSPVLLGRGRNNKGIEMWKVQVPMLVTYESAGDQKTRPIIVNLRIVKTPESMGVRGVGIEEFSIAPAPDKIKK